MYMCILSHTFIVAINLCLYIGLLQFCGVFFFSFFFLFFSFLFFIILIFFKSGKDLLGSLLVTVNKKP